MALTATTHAPNPSIIFSNLRAFQISYAVKSAIELGVFTAIAEGATSASHVAEKCHASERGIRILCDLLAFAGLLRKSQGQYLNTREGEVFLNRHSPAYIGSIADFLLNAETAQDYQTMTDCVRKGGSVAPGEGGLAPDHPMWVLFARAMGPLMAMPARMMAEMLPGVGPLRVLDIAAGHGRFGIAVAEWNPQAEITALDWAPVLEVAKENAAKAGVATRYQTIAGSAFDAEFGSDYDAVLLTNFLHHFDAATNERLLRKVHAALRPGGNAVTLEFCPAEDRLSPPAAATFAITMLVGTPAGDAYTFSEIEAMARNAGFARSEAHLLPTEQTVIVSTRS